MNPIIPFEIRLLRSHQLLAMLFIVHSIALLITLTMPLALGFKLSLALAIGLSMGYSTQHHFMRRGRHAVVGLRISDHGLKVETANGQWTSAKILASSYVTPWLTVLNLKLPQHRFTTHVVLLPDMLAAHPFRRLRMWLKWSDVIADGKVRSAVL